MLTDGVSGKSAFLWRAQILLTIGIESDKLRIVVIKTISRLTKLLPDCQGLMTCLGKAPNITFILLWI